MASEHFEHQLANQSVTFHASKQYTVDFCIKTSISRDDIRLLYLIGFNSNTLDELQQIAAECD